MNFTKMIRVSRLALLLAGVGVVGACSSDSDSMGAAPVPPAAAPADPAVPNSAGTSTESFVAYLKTLPAADDTSEPLVINSDFPAVAESTEEPAAL